MTGDATPGMAISVIEASPRSDFGAAANHQKLKAEIISELKFTMAEMIESRFKELEAILLARQSVPPERPSTCHDIPISVSSELCLKTVAHKLDLSQTA